MTWQQFLKSRGITWLLSLALIFVLFLTVRMFLQKYQIDKEIKKLEAETEKVKRDNEQLAGLIQYLQTPEYQEKQAREKLNLKKDGEMVVVLPDTDKREADQNQSQQPKANYKQWFDYFFGQK